MSYNHAMQRRAAGVCRRASAFWLVLVSAPAILLGRQFPAEARLLWERQSSHIAAFDQNGDSTDELLVYESDQYIVVRDQQLSVAGSSWNLDPGLRSVGRLGGNGVIVWAGARLNDSLFLVDLPRHRRLLLRNVPDTMAAPSWDVSVGTVALLDFDSDSDTEAVATVQAGFCRRPRSFVVLDWHSGRQEWTYETGPTVDLLLLRDVDGDGRLEILAGSAAPGNGNSANGTDDAHSYVFCLGSDGTKRWVRQVGEYGQAVRLVWLEADSGIGARLVAWESGCALDDAEPDSIFLLDPRDGSVLRTAQFGKWNRGCAALFGAERPFIALGNTDDTLRLLDSGLALVRKAALNSQGSVLLCSGSFTAPGRSEFCVATTDGRVRLYDASLRLLAETRTMNLTALVPIRFHGRNRLLAQSDLTGKTVWQLYDFAPVALLARRVPVLGVALAFLGLLVGFGAVLVGVRLRQTKDVKMVVRSLVGQAGLIELDSRGMLVRANPRGRELLAAAGVEPARGKKLDGTGAGAVLAELVQAAASDHAGAPGRETILSLGRSGSFIARASRVHRSIVLTIEETSAVDYVRRARAWIPAAQRLAHSIKSPLSTIQLAAEQMIADRKESARRIVEQSERVRKMADAIMRLTSLEKPNLVLQDLNGVVQRVVEAQGFALRPELRLELELASGLPLVRVDESQLGTALENVLDNAVEATNGTGAVRVTTRRPTEDGPVLLEVGDNGPGIAEEDRKRLFQQFFTRKPEGTGLGLMIVKKVVEDHGAEVEVESKHGKGTTVRLAFPVI